MWPITHILWLTYSFWCSSLKRMAIYSLELYKSFKLFTIGCGNSPRFISAWLMLDCFWNKLTIIKQNLSKHSHYLTRSRCKLSELVPEWAPLVLIVGLLSGHKNKTECEVEMKIKLNRNKMWFGRKTNPHAVTNAGFPEEQLKQSVCSPSSA